MLFLEIQFLIEYVQKPAIFLLSHSAQKLN